MTRCRYLTSAAVLLCASTPAAAQTRATAEQQPGDGAGLEEIIVTAQKREQSLQDVPLSVAAVSGEALENRNITEISQLQTATPNFSYSGSNNPRGAGITIRGIGTTNFSSAIEGSVGIMIDGVVVGRQGGGFTDLFDIERLEILRGPQGTLVGKNASAGVLNIVTRNPTATFEGRAQATYGEDEEFILRASASGPITDTLMARLSGYRSKRDGFITNVANGADLNNRDEWGGRGKVLFRRADDFELLLSGDYSERDANCCIWTTRIYGANAVLRNQQAAVGIVARPDNREVNLNGEVFIRQKVYGVSAQMDYTFPQDITATSITAARWWDAVDNNDADQTTLPILDINNGDSQQRQITQELRLTSPSRGSLQWVAGFFLFDQQYDLQNAQRGTFGVPLPPGTQLSRQINVANKTLNYAVFGDATVFLSEDFNLFGGLRYTIEELKTNFRRAPQPGTLPLGSVVNQSLQRDDDAVTWRFGAQYRPSGAINLYASVARGFKGGGFNALQDSPMLRTVEPEIPTAYEIGAKTELFDRRLRLNLAAFRTDFEDFQVQAITTSATGTLVFDVVNAGKLRTQGIEADFSARFVEGLSIDGGAAYTDATYADFANAPCFAGQTVAQGCVGAGATARQDLTGRRLANAPRFSANVAVRYEAPVTEALAAFGQVAYSHRSTTFTALDLDPRSVQKGYGLVDAQLGVRAFNDRFRVWVWGKNLTDERFAEAIFDTPLDAGGQSQFIPITAKRQFGITGEARF